MLRREIEEIGFAEVISVTGAVLAGLLLVFFEKEILSVPGIFILLPGFLAMKGSIGGSLSARIANAISKKQLNNKLIFNNIVAAFFLSVFVSFLLGLMAFILTKILFGVFLIKIIFVAVFAGILSSVLTINLTINTTIYLSKKGYDPANLMGPYITTIGDFIGILSLFISIRVLF